MNLGLKIDAVRKDVMFLLEKDPDGKEIPRLEVTISMKRHLCKLVDKYERATAKFGSFHTIHEAIGVIREEYLELEDAIFKNKPKARVEEEAIQVAAMCIRLLEDCLGD